MSSVETTPLLDSQCYSNEISEQTRHPPVVVVYRRRWYILCVFSLLSFIQAAVWNTWTAIADVSEVAMSWSDNDIALLTSWGTITLILSAFLFAWLMDVKVDKLAVHFRLIHTAQIINGFAGPVVMAMPPLLSATWFPANERIISTAIACGLTSLGVSASFIIGPLIVRDEFNKTYLDNRSKGFWALGGAYAISTGVNNGWTVVLDVNLKSIGIGQATSGYIAFAGIVAGSFGGIFVSVFARIFSRRIRLFLIVLYTVGTVAFLFFTLECASYIPFHQVFLYVLIIIGNLSVVSTVPLLYELICEETYPAAEGLTNTMVTWLNGIAASTFLLVLMIPTGT
ncbi:hypothetical protein LSH36_784g01043 [Paralvinella palmiformis]|uniref:Uncharacterized protein n=1 Tax=Paralvinella palmiformis TaxID=53620 RepID=A0AAD9J047_9ANNE|nr:hypothetical protein LSH36_784g01043 [Paralvinella palmiformis]